MKNRQKWLIITAITVIFGLVVAACDNGGNTHTYSSEWSSNATEHWKECTAADCDAKTETEKHTLNPLTKVSVSFGVFEDVCTRCNEIHAHEFTYAIGDTGPAGGIIFYVADDTDGRLDGISIQGYTGATGGSFAEYTAYYLEAAPANETNLPWGAQGTLIDGVTTFLSVGQNNTLTIGVGRKNTLTIVNSTAFAALTNTAAQRCASKSLNGFTDWFLPSLGELNEMYKAKGQTRIPTTGSFWSSSQGSNNNAWSQRFSDGDQDYGGKGSGYRGVRAVRAF